MRRYGFTQAELVTAVAVIGALASISIPRLIAKPEEAKATVCNSNFVIINKAIDIRMATRGVQPSLEEVLSDRSVFPDGPPQCPFGKDYVVGQYGHILPHNHHSE